MPRIKQMYAKDNLKVDAWEHTENGYLLLFVHFARWGIQTRYGWEISEEFEQNRLYKEYRPKEEVLKDVERWKHVVVTNDHPEPSLDKVNTKAYAVGFPASTVEEKEETVAIELIIYDKETIDAIKNGKTELSAGYFYQLEKVENQEYDFIQRNITPNHIAIVTAGRCGKKCSIAKDSNPKFKGEKMNELLAKILGLVPEDKKADAEALKSKILELSKTAKDANEALSTEITEKQVAIDQLQAKLDIVPKTATDADIEKMVNTLADEKATVLMVAKDCKIETDGKDTLALKKEIILKHNPKIALDKKSEEYVNASYDYAVTALKDANLSFLEANDLIPTLPAVDTTAKDKFDAKY